MTEVNCTVLGTPVYRSDMLSRQLICSKIHLTDNLYARQYIFNLIHLLL